MPETAETAAIIPTRTPISAMTPNAARPITAPISMSSSLLLRTARTPCRLLQNQTFRICRPHRRHLRREIAKVLSHRSSIFSYNPLKGNRVFPRHGSAAWLPHGSAERLLHGSAERLPHGSAAWLLHGSAERLLHGSAEGRSCRMVELRHGCDVFMRHGCRIFLLRVHCFIAQAFRASRFLSSCMCSMASSSSIVTAQAPGTKY